MGEGEGREEERGGKTGGREGRKGEEKRREERKKREGEEYNNSLCTLCVSVDWVRREGGERRWEALFLGSSLKKHPPPVSSPFFHTHTSHISTYTYTHTFAPSSSSGGRYHRVTTTGVYCLRGEPYSRARPKSPTYNVHIARLEGELTQSGASQMRQRSAYCHP